MSDGLGLALATSLPFSLVQSSFSPLDVAGIAGWWDASDTATLTEISDAVSQWDDKSGLGNHVVQATALQQPLTGQDNQNGLNGVKFDGINDEMLRIGMNKLVQEWFLVFKIGATHSSNGGLLSNTNDKGNIRFDPGNSGQCRYDNDAVIPGAPGDANDFGDNDGQFNPDGITGSVLADLTFTLSVAHRLHCTRGDNIADAGNVYTDFGIGSDEQTNRHLNCTIYEIIGYDVSLSAQDRTDLREYLRVKWGVA